MMEPHPHHRLLTGIGAICVGIMVGWALFVAVERTVYELLRYVVGHLR